MFRISGRIRRFKMFVNSAVRLKRASCFKPRCTSHQIGFECFDLIALSLCHVLTSSHVRVCLSWG